MSATANQILHSAENGDLESQLVDGQVQILIDLKCVLTFPKGSQISVGADNMVTVGENQIPCESASDAETVASVLADLERFAT